MKAGLAAALGVLVAGGCGGSSGAETSIRLVVPDKNVRAEGVECAGARPFQQVHEGATFSIEADDGAVVVDGTLPVGHAENAEPGIDWGAERIPTFCVLDFHVDLPERPRYRFVLEGLRPLEFVVDEEPVVLVVG